MKLFSRLFFLLCLPGIIWHSPLRSETIPANVEITEDYRTFSPWDLLNYESLSYDRILNFIDEIEYGNVLDKCCSEQQLLEIRDFVIFLARNGIPSWDAEGKEQLERDITNLLSDEDDDEEGIPWWFSNFNSYKGFMITPAVFRYYDKSQVMLCKNWFGKKWNKTTKFVKNHKKAVIIAAVVVVVATVAIVVTSGAATPLITGGAAGGSKSISSDDKEKTRAMVNKPGEVQFGEDRNAPPQNNAYTENTQPIDTYTPHLEPPPNITIPVQAAVVQYSEEIKSELSEIVPNEAFNIVENEQTSFWKEAKDKARETGSHLAHEVYGVIVEQLEIVPQITGAVSNNLPKYLQNADPFEKEPRESFHEMVEAGHERIDEIFGTEQADMYSADGKAARGELTTGMLPPPGAIGNALKLPSKAYEIAKNGGKHADLIERYSNVSNKELQKSIKSYEKQIAKHQDKIANPSKHCPDWETMDLRHKESLVEVNWPAEIELYTEQRDIVQSILDLRE